MKNRASIGVRATGFVLACLGLTAGRVEAGPPFVIDGPGTPGTGHYEFTVFSTGTQNQGGTGGALPAFEFNYGIAPQAMVHIVAPVGFNDAGGTNHYGYGDTELGFKYLLIHEDKNGFLPAIGIYPQVEAPTGDQGQGLGAGHTRAFLPVWLEKNYGPWTINAGGGYWINQDSTLGTKDYGLFGGLIKRQITPNFALGGEIFHKTASTVGGKDATSFDIGAIYDFDQHNHFMISAGSGLQNATENNEFSWYVGYRLTY